MVVPSALASYVTSLVAYDVDLGEAGTHRGLPSPDVTLVLPVGQPLEVTWSDDPGTVTTGWSNVSGLHTRPAEIRHDGTQHGVQVALTLQGARALLGLPAAALAGELVDLDQAAPHLRDLPAQLGAAPAGERAALVTRALLRVLAGREAARPRPEVARAVARLTRGAGVQEVADEVGYSRRHLSALVRDECGLAPQQVRRVGRLQASRALVGRLPLAEVAARCGYADQAHLSREWGALAGCTPTTWLREEFPFVQDLPPAPEAGSDA